MPALSPLLHARSVAIVGISQPERFGGQVYTNLARFGFPGKIYPVNPRYERIFDQACYPSLNALPQRPDLAVLAIPNRALLGAFEETASLGIPAAVIFASAFDENGSDPQALEQAIAALARQQQMALCGANCMGFLSLGHRLVISGYPVLPGTPAGPVTFISHSGSVFDSIWPNNRQITFNYVVSAGNETATTVADYMRFALRDPSTTVIGLFLETVRDPAGFRLALEEAAERDVPVVALKVGRSKTGARLAQSHSGALAGDDAVYEALFAHYGVSRVRSLDEMMDTLELFAPGWRPRPGAIAATLDSGGERAMLVDMAEDLEIPFAEISAETQAVLASTLEPGLEPINPLDAWGTGNQVERIYRDSLLAMDADPATGLNLFAVDLMRASDLPPTYGDVVLPILSQFSKPLVFLVNVTASASETQMAELRSAGLPVLMGTETGLRAIRHLFDYCASRDRRRPDGPTQAPSPLDRDTLAALRQTLAQARAPLDEYASKQLLARYGLPVPAEQPAESLEQALAAAEAIGYPVALKTAAGLLHKTEAGGLHLNLSGPEALQGAFRDLAGRLGPRVLVQQMSPAGPELLLGLIHDPQFGLLLSIGTGGTLVEVLDDTRLILLPAGAGDVRRTLHSLRGAALLRGARGQPAVDEDAIIRAALSLAALAADLGDLIAEVDINPLIGSPRGVLAVDALIVPKTSAAPTPPNPPPRRNYA